MRKTILIIISILLTGAASLAWNGFVFVQLWRWFVVPAFGLPAINIPTAIGIGILIRLLTYSTPNQQDDDFKKAMARTTAYAFVPSAVYLVIGWVVYGLFMGAS